jgi:endonuclease YncB( thermonuclease family)
LVGEVVGVTDGDTFTMVDTDKNQHKIRIAGIDAPEKGQPFGEVSHQNLSRLIFRRSVEARCYKWSYKRRVCNVFVGGNDVGLDQVQAGLAWHYKRFANEQTPFARDAYSRAEGAARGAKIGLWNDPGVISPWDWRRRTKVK